MVDQQIDITTEEGQKRLFAYELLCNPDDAFKAALAVFGDDTGKALQLSTQWKNDQEVARYVQEYKEELGDEHFLPSKADSAMIAYKIANDAKVPAEDRLKALRLYADIRGFIEKQGTTVNNNILTSNKVMVVKDHGTDDEWEDKIAAQQAKLIETAHAPSPN
jgi:hypothetical protein